MRKDVSRVVHQEQLLEAMAAASAANSKGAVMNGLYLLQWDVQGVAWEKTTY
jgi:hypothetical protein